MREKILSKLDEGGSLPPLPDILVKLQQTVNDPKSQLNDIAQIIELEPVLAGKIMTISNSPYYLRGAGAVKDLRMAVGKLGTKELVRIAYSIKLSTLFTDSTVMDAAQFWRHSLAVAVFAQSLAVRLRKTKDESGLVYLAGLLHDIGVMVFACLVKDEYPGFLKTIIEKEEPLEVQEAEAFGIDHAELGTLFIRKWWNLDEAIAEIVLHHHDPLNGAAPGADCAMIVNAANGIIGGRGLTNGIFCFHGAFDESAWFNMGLSAEDAQDILSSVESAIDQASVLLR